MVGASVVPLPSAKRARMEELTETQDKESLTYLCSERVQNWEAATKRAQTHPQEARPLNPTVSATPLALACRSGAPAFAIRAILDAAPHELRRLLVARGTPLHEAIVCQTIGADVVELLLKKDEDLEGHRACLMQDVDGHTPLHLLIRRRSTTHVLNGSDSHWKTLLELMVKSCPEAVGVPDRGEYEEPPLVMALKASLYAGIADMESDEFVRVEFRIHEIVRTMLRYNPGAASQVLTGARGNYTAIHSAVFHGRCCDTIQLLLEAKRDASALLLANTQGELPLHFATMRGESPRSVELLAQAAPMAVLKRDVSGLTPLHWLWVRFVSTLILLDEKGTDNSILDIERPTHPPPDQYTAFWMLEKGEFYADLNLIRRLDSPVDFLRMRHIPPELFGPRAGTWAERSVNALSVVRERRLEQMQEDGGALHRIALDWTRLEAVTSLFWTKVVSLLREASNAHAGDDDPGPFRLVHAAMSTYSCPSQVARMTAMNFPEDLARQDHKGRLPLHCAAMRRWHAWDWRSIEACGGETAAGLLLRAESLSVLRIALDHSQPDACKVRDNDGKLVLHHAVDSFVAACSSRMIDNEAVKMMLELLRKLVVLYGDALEKREPDTRLYPFLQATAAATSQRAKATPTGYSVPFPEEMPLSITFVLLKENPSIVSRGIPRPA